MRAIDTVFNLTIEGVAVTVTAETKTNDRFCFVEVTSVSKLPKGGITKELEAINDEIYSTLSSSGKDVVISFSPIIWKKAETV